MTDPVGPICHLPGDTPDPNTQPALLPPIPIATNLASALMAINAMRTIIHQITGQTQSRPSGSTGFKFKNDDAKKNKQGRWQEANRVSETVKIKNPDDENQFVEVKRINELTMRDSQTGETWVWKRGA